MLVVLREAVSLHLAALEHILGAGCGCVSFPCVALLCLAPWGLGGALPQPCNLWSLLMGAGGAN